MAINPLQFFDVGRQAGAVGSAAYGPNFAVTKMLEKAEKLGLVNAQTQGAINIAQTKANAEPTTNPFYTYGAEGDPTYRGELPAGAVLRSETGGIDPLTQAIAEKLLNPGGDTPPPDEQQGANPFAGLIDGAKNMAGSVFGGKAESDEAAVKAKAPAAPVQAAPAQISPVDQALLDAIKNLTE